MRLFLGRVIAPKKARIVQQRKLKKVSGGLRAAKEGAWKPGGGGQRMVPGPGGGTWRTQLSESQFLSTPVPWVPEHHVPRSAGLGGARPDAQRVFSTR